MLAILAGNPRGPSVAIIAITSLTLVTGGNGPLKATQDKAFGIASSGYERVAMLKPSDINAYSAALPLEKAVAMLLVIAQPFASRGLELIIASIATEITFSHG